MESSRPKRAAVRKGASDAKDEQGPTKVPASKTAKNKAVESKAGPSGGAGDHVAAPPKETKGTKATSKITVPRGRVQLQEQRQRVIIDADSSAGSSPELGNSKKVPPTPYPPRFDFSSSAESSNDEMQEDVVEEPVKKKVVPTKATTTTTKAKAGSKKAVEPMEDDGDLDKEAVGNVSGGAKDDDVKKPEEQAKKIKPGAKKVAAKPKVGSKRAAPPSPKPEPQVQRDDSLDEEVADADSASSPEKGKKAAAVKKGQVKGKAVAKKATKKPAEEVDEELGSGSNEEDNVVKPDSKGRARKPAITMRGRPKGKKAAADEDQDQHAESAEEKPSGKGPKAAAKGVRKEALTDEKKPARGNEKPTQVKSLDDSADVINASSDEDEDEGGPMSSSAEEIAMELGLMKQAAVKRSPPKNAETVDEVGSPGKSGDDEARVITDSDRSGSGSGSDNKENNSDVVMEMDNLKILSEESGPEGAAAHPAPEPPKKRAVAGRKKPEPSVASKAKAGPAAANRVTKNRTMPTNLESAKATAATASEDFKKNLLARKSYATRSKAKARATTSTTTTAKK